MKKKKKNYKLQGKTKVFIKSQGPKESLVFQVRNKS